MLGSRTWQGQRFIALPFTDKAFCHHPDFIRILLGHALDDFVQFDRLDLRANHPPQRNSVYQGGMQFHVAVADRADPRPSQERYGPGDRTEGCHLSSRCIWRVRGVINILESKTECIHSIPQRGRAGLIGGRHQPAVHHLTGQPP